MNRLNILKFSIFLVANIFFQSICAQGSWGYSGNTGPEYWGNLNAKYRLCASGKKQSPINIGLFTSPARENLYFNYQKAPLDLVLNSKNLYINMRHSRSEYVDFQGQRYFLQHLHFHAPAEHTFYGKRYPLEAHLVHKNKQGELLVIGVLIKEGQKNDILHQLFSVPFPAQDHEEIFETVYINPGSLIPQNSRYYLYSGSLTTPPCSENVVWAVMKKPIEASSEEIRFFKEKVSSFNARPLQPLNKRPVYHSQAR